MCPWTRTRGTAEYCHRVVLISNDIAVYSRKICRTLAYEKGDIRNPGWFVNGGKIGIEMLIAEKDSIVYAALRFYF